MDLRPLGWIRAAIGALILLRTTPLLAPLDIWFLRDTWPLLGWPEPGFGSAPLVVALPALAVQILCVLRTAAALLFMLGVASRLTGIVAGVAGYLVLLQNPFGFIFTLHLFYQAAILVALADSGSAFALRPARPLSPASSYLLLRLWVASIYLWAGIHKLRPDWLDGRAIELFHHRHALHGVFADLLLATPLSRAITATGVAVLEMALGPLLLIERTRRVALLMAWSFHLALEIVGRPDLLGWGMAALLFCFLGPPLRFVPRAQ